jgi:hypothetical protein
MVETGEGLVGVGSRPAEAEELGRKINRCEGEENKFNQKQGLERKVGGNGEEGSDWGEGEKAEGRGRELYSIDTGDEKVQQEQSC